MEYYTADDVKRMTGYSMTSVYRLIRSLNKTLKKEFPNQIIFQAKVPVWYWNRVTKGEDNSEKSG